MNALERQAVIEMGPWILFDGSCNLCNGGAARLGPIARRRGFRLAALQSRIGRAFDTGRDEIHVVTRYGRVIGGGEAFAYICLHVWWAMPLALLWHLPGCRWVMNPAYRCLARNRYRLSGVCGPVQEVENPYAVEL